MKPIDPIVAAIRDVPDFPRPGIIFKDITPVLGDGDLFRQCVDRFAEESAGKGVSKVAGIDARGFVFGAAVAHALGLGFVPIRKKGKLPFWTVSQNYALEYGEAAVEIHVDAISQGEKVLLIDDLLATGGTALASVALLHRLGAHVVEAQFLVELSSLKGRAALAPTPVFALVTY